MEDEDTPRLGLPLLRAGQAQKEVMHNEALAALDLLVQAGVESIGSNAPPADPVAGRAWIIGSDPQGAWAGRAHMVAGWTDAGWRFATPVGGMTAWVAAERLPARFIDGGWRLGDVHATRLLVGGVPVLGSRRAAIAEPEGGAVVDAEARARINMILAAMRDHGLIAP
ncbi:MAG TPA: DUF2793 domain-containing protein [Sphingomonas sp.]|jgi:hypothetical protein